MSAARPRDRDRESLRRLAAGDTAALDTTWQDHADRVFRHALWVTRRREDAEDAVSATFVRLAGLGADLLGIRDLASYLATMVRREAIVLVRRRGEHDEVFSDADSLLAAVPNPEEDADRRRLAAQAAELPLAQREVVFFHLWGGFTFREIGRMTGVSTFTAASRFRLAMGRLRHLLEESAR